MSMTSQLIGTNLSNSSLASLINSTNPILIMILAYFFLGEKITFVKLMGLLSTIIGAVFIIGYSFNNSNQFIGIVFSLLAVISWSFISILIKKVSKEVHPIRVTASAMIIAAACSSPFAILEVTTKPVHLDGITILALLYMSVFCTALAYTLWNKALGEMEASKCSSFYPLQPLFSALLGSIFLNEPITTDFMIGGFLITLGVIAINYKKKERLVIYDARK